MRSYRFLTWCLMMVSALFMTSCFDILEEYEFNADGSGKARMVIDVSKMVEMMASFSAFDSTGEAQQSMDDMFTENGSVETLKQLSGISNVVSLNNKAEGKIGYSYEFASIEDLNNAIAATSNTMDMAALGIGDGSLDTEGGANFFEQKGKKMIRKVEYTPKDEDGDAEADQYEEMAKTMFGDAKYNVSYTFAQGVKKVKKNANASLGPNGRTVNISMSMLDVIDQKANPGCEVILKTK